MGIEQITLKQDATSAAITGGTDLVFESDGQPVNGGIHVMAPAVTDFRVRPNITFKTKSPVLNNGVYSKGKRWITPVFPKILADGTTVYNLSRIEIEVHPETTEAERSNQILITAQLLFNAAVQSFLTSGSLK